MLINNKMSLISSNSELQKKRCRVAAKARRLKESEYFQELGKLINNSTGQAEHHHLDKISLIRLRLSENSFRGTHLSNYGARI